MSINKNIYNQSSYFKELREIENLANTQKKGMAFEIWCMILLIDAGIPTCLTHRIGANDGGIDLLSIFSSNKKTAIQCKCWKGDINKKIIIETDNKKSDFDCLDSIVITNGLAIPEVIEFAKTKGVKIWDIEKILNLIGKANHRSCYQFLNSNNIEIPSELIIIFEKLGYEKFHKKSKYESKFSKSSKKYIDINNFNDKLMEFQNLTLNNKSKNLKNTFSKPKENFKTNFTNNDLSNISNKIKPINISKSQAIACESSSNSNIIKRKNTDEDSFFQRFIKNPGGIIQALIIITGFGAMFLLFLYGFCYLFYSILKKIFS